MTLTEMKQKIETLSGYIMEDEGKRAIYQEILDCPYSDLPYDKVACQFCDVRAVCKDWYDL